MAVNQRMELRQAQTLVMTPRLQQAIRLLEMSSQELAAYVEREVEQNPLLERADSAIDQDDDGGTQDEWAAADRPSVDRSAVDRPSADRPLGDRPLGDRQSSDRRAADSVSAERPTSSDHEPTARNDKLGDDEAWSGGEHNGAGAASMADDDRPWQSSTTNGSAPAREVSGAVSLREHLLEQINIDFADPQDRRIGALLVDLLDEAGYVTGDLKPVADRLACPLARVEATLARLQQLDPPGIFARNLKECLALQLKERNRLDPAMRALIDNLELLAAGKRDRLLRLCGVDADDLADMVAEIRTLNPKPAEIFTAVPALPVTPDIVVRLAGDGGWIVELHPDAVPRVLINHGYIAQMRAATPDKAARAFISDRLGAANWLVRTLQQRTGTILKVAAEIARRQDGFLRHGVQHLKPLTRREIAEAVGLHESTVSRATTNKYVATPRGLYALRYFFASALADSAGGLSHSAEAVRMRIRELITGEHENDILSDDRLTAILRAEGVAVARRTVAKYREFLRIPTSARRRRAKALHLR
ncbi:MAG TPA: RNA polymerase factor sigma-54 [Dongiaceae bacterium]|nr:RNA polymerase factor sigma-54 [Dongiaceae bacterium]